jgi:hypothetical protein
MKLFRGSFVVGIASIGKSEHELCAVFLKSSTSLMIKALKSALPSALESNEKSTPLLGYIFSNE